MTQTVCNVPKAAGKDLIKSRGEGVSLSGLRGSSRAVQDDGLWYSISLVVVAVSIAINSALAALIVVGRLSSLFISGHFGLGGVFEPFLMGTYIAFVVVLLGLPLGLLAEWLTSDRSLVARYVAFALAGAIAGAMLMFGTTSGDMTHHTGILMVAAIISSISAMRFSEFVRSRRVLAVSSIVVAGMLILFPLG